MRLAGGYPNLVVAQEVKILRMVCDDKDDIAAEPPDSNALLQ